MKTVLIAHNYSKESFASMSYYLAHSLADNGFKVVFISHQPYFKLAERKKTKKGELIVLSWSSGKRPTGFLDFLHFYKIYIRHKPSIVIGHFVGSNISIFTAKLLSLFQIKSIAYYHTISKSISIDSTKNNFLLKLLVFRKKVFYHLFLDKLICPSSFASDDLSSLFSVKKDKILTIPNSLPDRLVTKKKLPSGSIVISYLGRLDKSKNILALINSFKRFLENTPSQSIDLQIAGSGSLQHEVELIANASDHITFLGKLDYNDVDSYLLNSHFTIIPSLYDNLPTVGLESLMNGTPILISENTGLSEYCTNDIDCFKFKPNEEQMTKLFQSISNKPIDSYYKSMSGNARNTYLNKFSITIYNERMLKILSQ